MTDELELLVYEPIDDIFVRDQIQMLKDENPSYLVLRINSQGGSAFAGISLYNYIKGKYDDVEVYIDGLAASAASIIAMCGHVIMPEGSTMMLHNPWGFCEGDSDEMRKMSETLDVIRDAVADIYVGKTGLSKEEILSLMDAETWMTAEKAYELNLADEIRGKLPESKPEPKDEAKSYEQGVADERARLQALDELMTPERRSAINEAKYRTFESATDIAVKLLKRTPSYQDMLLDRKLDSLEVDGMTQGRIAPEDAVSVGVKMMNRMRGYE